MPLPSYTARRRIMMQAAMVVLLGGTLGLAALLTSHRGSQEVVPFDVPVRWVDRSLSLPTLKGWSGWDTDADANGSFLLNREPPSATPEPAWRQMTVRTLPPSNVSLAGLAESMVQKYQFVGYREVDRTESKLGGRRTIVVRFDGKVPVESGPSMAATRFVACSLLPQGRGLIVELEVLGRPPAERDVGLIRDFTDEVKVVGARD